MEYVYLLLIENNVSSVDRSLKVGKTGNLSQRLNKHKRDACRHNNSVTLLDSQMVENSSAKEKELISLFESKFGPPRKGTKENFNIKPEIKSEEGIRLFRSLLPSNQLSDELQRKKAHREERLIYFDKEIDLLKKKIEQLEKEKYEEMKKLDQEIKNLENHSFSGSKQLDTTEEESENILPKFEEDNNLITENDVIKENKYLCPGCCRDLTEVTLQKNNGFCGICSNQQRFDFSNIWKYPNKKWLWSGLSKHPQLDLSLVKNFPDRSWNYDRLLEVLGINHELAKSFPNTLILKDGKIEEGKYLCPGCCKDFAGSTLRKNNGFCGSCKKPDFSNLQKYPRKRWMWRKLFQHPEMTDLIMVKLFPDNPWEWDFISSESEDIVALFRLFPNKPWDYWLLMYNHCFDFDLIHEFPDKPWIWGYKEDYSIPGSLSSHPDLDPDLVRKFPNKPWVWGLNPEGDDGGLSSNENLDFNLVREFPNKPWDWSYLSERSDLDLKLVQEFSNKPWDWSYLSGRSDLDLKLVQEFSNKPWDWSCLSKRGLVKPTGIPSIIDLTRETLKENDESGLYPGRYLCPGCYKDFAESTLSRNKGFCGTCNSARRYDISIIEKFPQKKWLWSKLVLNPNLNNSLIQKLAKEK